MSWAIGYDDKWNRDVGYGVPAICDRPRCNADINRGLSYVCGSEPFGGELGCGLYFCTDHLYYVSRKDTAGEIVVVQLCTRCRDRRDSYEAKPDTAEWMRWKLTDESWQQWREENPNDVAQLAAATSIISDEKEA